MHTASTIQFEGKSLRLRLSSEARKALLKRDRPLHVEMELYFSCMIRKKVRFFDQALDSTFRIAVNRLELGFRPVMTQQCSVHETDGPPPVTDFPIANPAGFIPHWLDIDYRNGEWQGEFGYL